MLLNAINEFSVNILCWNTTSLFYNSVFSVLLAGFFGSDPKESSFSLNRDRFLGVDLLQVAGQLVNCDVLGSTEYELGLTCALVLEAHHLPLLLTFQESLVHVSSFDLGSCLQGL